MKVILFALILMFTMCGTQNKLPINIKSKPIKSVVITDNKTGIDVKVIDEQWIEDLFDNYVNTATKEPRKFITKYKITFTYQKQDYNLLINSNYLKIEGVSYKSNSDIEVFIQKKMNEVQ